MAIARLLLEDGTSFEGSSFGAPSTCAGEVIFNTSSAGFQEIATDPSYSFQIVVMTRPPGSNYGTERGEEQSERPQIAGMVVQDLTPDAPSSGSKESLASYFERSRIPGISGIDTQELTSKIRSGGAMMGIITSDPSRTAEDLLAELRKAPSLKGLDLVQRVTALRTYPFDRPDGRTKRRVAVYDFGVKRNILHHLSTRFDLVVYPASTHPDEILNQKFDGVVLSNGPGDPEPVTYAQENIRQLIGRVPLFGLCLGHQLLALALGAKTYKLKFGHRGGDHPVQQIQTGRVEITTQNHGFAVDADSIRDSEIELTHVNLNDGTVEGFRHRSEPAIAVQYHPEAAPGPHDSFFLFDTFAEMIESFQSRGRD